MTSMDLPFSVSRSLLAGVVTLFSLNAHAAIFVDIPGIPGDSQDATHREQITASAAGGDFAKNRCSKFTIAKQLDKATPLLIAATVSARAFPQIIVDYTSSAGGGGSVSLATITLNSARVARVSTKVDVDEPTVEEVRIRATSITVDYNEYDATGALRSTVSETVQCGKVLPAEDLEP